MLDQIKELWKLRKQMEELKKKLDGISIEAVSKDGTIKLTVSGSQEVKAVTVTGDLAAMKADKLAENIKETVNRAFKMSQQEAAKVMAATPGLQLPGM